MKLFTLYISLFISVLSFAQNTGSIQGHLLDLESNNEPLLYAKVLIEETGSEILTDEKGAFKFDKLKNGNYTLVSSFTGYEAKKTTINVTSGKPTNIKLSLKASTLSLDDLVLTLASADNKTPSTSLNK